MRIITGQYKGRHFDIPRSFKARPTTDFAKENIFNVLQNYIDFEDATALDLFAGTGSISLELVSRGCSRVISVEADRDHANFIRECFKKLGEDRDLLIRGDVFRFLENLQAEVRFHLCRSAIRTGEAPRDSRPRTQWRSSQRRGHLRFRAWQELRFLRPSKIPGA